jgi:hypothetical protein
VLLVFPVVRLCYSNIASLICILSCVRLLYVNLATPDPTPCSLLLPSVYACMVCLLSYGPSIILTKYVG